MLHLGTGVRGRFYQSLVQTFERLLNRSQRLLQGHVSLVEGGLQICGQGMLGQALPESVRTAEDIRNRQAIALEQYLSFRFQNSGGKPWKDWRCPTEERCINRCSLSEVGD